jgi:hypothetical protein
VDGRQHRQQHAADRRQGQADHMHHQIGRLLGRRTVMLLQIEGIGLAGPAEQRFQSHEHGPF